MKCNKFIEIVPGYNFSHNLLPKEDYMALPVNSVVDDFESVEYILLNPQDKFNPNRNQSTISKIRSHLDKRIKIVVLKGFWNYMRYLIINRKAVIFANDRIFSSFLAGIICKKTVFMSHQSALPNGFFKKVIFRFFVKRFKKIKVSNPYEKEKLISIGVNNDKIVYIPLSIDYDFFIKRNIAVRKKYNIKENEKIIMYVGNIRKFKNPYNLLKAFKEVIRENKLAHLVVIGPDYLEDEGGPNLKDFSNQLGILDKVDLLGFLSPRETAELMNTAEIGIIPSYHEGQCIVAYEFAAAGIPLCLSSIGSFTSVFKESALFCNPDDYKTLAANILKYIDDKKLVEKHTTVNRKIVKERCDYDIVKARLRELFVSLK